MDWNFNFINEDSEWRYLITGLLFLLLFLIIIGIVSLIGKHLEKRAKNSKSSVDDFIIRILKVPSIWIIFSILLNIFSTLFDKEMQLFSFLEKVSEILLILTIGWFVIQGIRALFRYFQNKIDISISDNLIARKRLTQLKMIEKILIVVAAVLFVSIALLTFEAVRGLGISLLASAGILGIVVGFAAQQSVGLILSGIQVALTQPIRLDDVVIVEGEWGRVEEINITYVVVKIWDERRMVIPVDYFLNTPFQNWTRTTSDILGTVMLYVSYDLPVDPLRKYLEKILKDDHNWDGRVQNIQVTDSKQWYKEIRILLSSSNSSTNWDLRVSVREKLIDFINKTYPGSFSRIDIAETRIKSNNNNKISTI